MDIKYPEEVREDALERYLSLAFAAARDALLDMIREESERGKVYGHFC